MKCAVTTCPNPPATRVQWPGGTVGLCWACSSRALGAAELAGFVVEWHPLELAPAPANPVGPPPT